jgi:phosphoenolpyruvate-protein kinase (PTS system EI component)
MRAAPPKSTEEEYYTRLPPVVEWERMWQNIRREDAMGQALAGKVIKRTKDSVDIRITKENFESFCDSIGLYRREFLAALDASEKDHRAGRITKRKSLRELIG